MSVLIIAEHNQQKMNPGLPALMAAALQLDDKPSVLVVGYQCQKVADELSKLSGVARVLTVDNVVYEHPLAENLSKLIAKLAPAYTHILASASTFGKNLMPRVAASLQVPQVSDVCKIIDADTFEHPIYAGNAIETVKILPAIKVMTIRESAFKGDTAPQEPCSIEKMDMVIEEKNTRFIKQELSQSKRPDLSQAKIVVSGGRALQSAEKFKLMEALADALGAALGASRAAVDAGFVSNEYQVGQTGRIVAPDLYVAVGISGAIQHLAGMKDSKVIVAINKDADAPIFQVADYGLVGDLFTLVPELIKELTIRKTL